MQLAPMTVKLSPLFWSDTIELTKPLEVFKEFYNKSLHTHLICHSVTKQKNQTQFVKISFNNS